MRNHALTALACLGTVLVGGGARAQQAEDCPPPTEEQCRSDSRVPNGVGAEFWNGPCGQLERARWATGEGGLCSSYLTEDITVPGSQARVVYLPLHARHNHETLVTSASAPYSYASHYSDGMLGAYAHLGQSSAVAALRDRLDVSTLPDRRAWASNGNAVRSCDEYAYEKYYDYSQFEDAVAVSGGDARAVFEAAFAPGRLGARALGGAAAASKSRNSTFHVSITGVYPKNVYFELQTPRYPRNQEREEYHIDPELLASIAGGTPVAHGLARRLTVLGDAEDTLHFDPTDYVELGGNAGGRVYGREGAYYGLEVSVDLLPFAAP